MKTRPTANPKAEIIYEYDGEQLNQSQLAKKTGIARQTLQQRLNAGLSVEEATDNDPAERKRMAIEQRIIQAEISKTGAEMTEAMLRRVFKDNKADFLQWVDDQMKNNSFKFMAEILPKYLRLFEAKETEAETDEKAVVNIIQVKAGS